MCRIDKKKLVNAKKREKKRKDKCVRDEEGRAFKHERRELRRRNVH